MSKEIIIDGVKYVPETKYAKRKDEMDLCIVRTYSAGVFYGYIESRSGTQVIVRSARRLWRWAGANTLSELSLRGSLNPAECKFCAPVDKLILTEVIEILFVTEEAQKNIDAIPAWE